MSANNEKVNVERQPVRRACDQCRRKKIKCDRGSLKCEHCQRLNLDCSYNDEEKKRGPLKGYTDAIADRFKDLEVYLTDIIETNENDHSAKEILKRLKAPLKTPHGETFKDTHQHKRQRRHQQQLSISPTAADSSRFNSSTTIQNTNDADGALTVDDHGQVRYLGNSSGFHLLSGSRTYKDGLFYTNGLYRPLNKDQQQSKKHTCNVDPFELPDEGISSELLSIYFEHFYPVLPLFFKKNMEMTEEPMSILLLNAVYAIASRMSSNVYVRSDASLPDTAGDVFFERASCLLEGYYDTPRISTVQALLLLTSHQMGGMKPARAWIYGGMAFRMAQDLGLNRNCDHWDISADEKERRKRVFWCCFIMDRFMSASYGRSANFDERDCDAPLPSVDDDEPLFCLDPAQPPVRLLDVFIQSVKMATNLGHVLENIYYAKSKERTNTERINRTLNTLHAQLTQWHNDLTPALQYQLPDTQNGESGPAPPSAVYQLHLMYYTALILLHRPFIQSRLPIYLPCFKICEAAATSIMDIVNIMLSKDLLRYTHNSSVYYVFTAGTIFVKLSASSQDAERTLEAKINTNGIIRALDNIEMTWMNASRCCNILGELAGVRDIKLVADRYVPDKAKKADPLPSIAVPNSPDNACCAAPPVSSDPVLVQPVVDLFDPQADILHSLDEIFWSIPSSLDVSDWNNYFENITTAVNLP